MKALILTATIAIASAALAAPIPAAVSNAAAKMKAADVRTIITKTPGDNPCDSGYAIQIQVKKAGRGGADGMTVVYSWETVKEVSSDAQGNIIEVCME